MVQFPSSTDEGLLSLRDEFRWPEFKDARFLASSIISRTAPIVLAGGKYGVIRVEADGLCSPYPSRHFFSVRRLSTEDERYAAMPFGEEGFVALSDIYATKSSPWGRYSTPQALLVAVEDPDDEEYVRIRKMAFQVSAWVAEELEVAHLFFTAIRMPRGLLPKEWIENRAVRVAADSAGTMLEQLDERGALYLVRPAVVMCERCGTPLWANARDRGPKGWHECTKSKKEEEDDQTNN